MFSSLSDQLRNVRFQNRENKASLLSPVRTHLQKSVLKSWELIISSITSLFADNSGEQRLLTNSAFLSSNSWWKWWAVWGSKSRVTSVEIRRLILLPVGVSFFRLSVQLFKNACWRGVKFREVKKVWDRVWSVWRGMGDNILYQMMSHRTTVLEQS